MTFDADLIWNITCFRLEAQVHLEFPDQLKYGKFHQNLKRLKRLNEVHQIQS